MRLSTASVCREVPPLTDQQIADQALLLLTEYGQQRQPVVRPPVPIEEILEVHLKLALEICDLQAAYGHPDLLGAIWFKDRLVRIDQSLDPAKAPKMMGRFHFTLAHEVAHWWLHREHFADNADPATEGMSAPTFICRTSAKPRLEKQADIFAANLLMPAGLVLSAWPSWRSRPGPVYLDSLWDDYEQAIADELALRPDGQTPDRRVVENVVLELFSRPFAQCFEVSSEAMRIRLESLGLLIRRREPR